MLEEDARHRRDRCMQCDKTPDFEVLWAEGMAHAWFCKKHLIEWLTESLARCAKEGFSNKNCGVNSVKKIDGKEASKKFGENKNGNILPSFLSKITMPEVNKEEKEGNPKEDEDLALSKKDCVACDLVVCTEECFNAHPGSFIALTKLLHSLDLKATIINGESKLEKLAPVNPSGVELGEEITLDGVKPFFKSFYRTRPYISLIGGICNWGKTKGDIDIFIRSAHRDLATEFRIIRSFPKKYWFRFQFHYPYEQESHPGLFTNHMDIYNEKIEVISKPELVLMSVPKKVELFKFAKLLKPAHGHYKGEEYSIDKLIEVVNAKPEWYEKGIYVQKKFDGVHVRCDVKRHYESGFDIKIWTEEGNEISVRLPTLCNALGKASEGHAMALVGELEFWEDKKHQSRQKTTAIIHTKEDHPDEGKVILNVFDILFYNKKDIHNKPYSDRRKSLAKIEDTKHIKKANFKLVHSPTELRKAVEHYAGLPGSEGAYLKRSDFFYELDGKTLLNLKYKNTFSVDAKVIEVHKVKDADAWNYLCVIKDEKGNDIPIGRTYNTSIKVSKGDILKVEFVNLNQYETEDGKVWFSWWSPHVIMAREDKRKPDNTLTAEKLVKVSKGTVAEKKWPKRYLDSVLNSLDWVQPYRPAKSTNKQLADDWRLFVATVSNLDAGKHEPFSYKEIYVWATACLKEIAKRVKASSMKFSISKQKSAAYRKLWRAVSKKVELIDAGGEEQDADLGYTESPSEDKKWLGMLQFDSRKKNVGIDFRWQVSNSMIAAFTVFVPQGLSAVPKNPADAKRILTKEILPLVKENLADPLKKLNCQPKRNINATKDVFEEVIGYGPGYERQRFMWTVDSFTVSHGCKKPHFVELFCEGDLVSGRMLFVKIPNKAEWEKTPEGDYTWMCFLPKTQLPYVLSARAVKKKFVPPYKASALPRKIRDKIPGRYQYWKIKDASRRRELRDELVEEIKKKLLKLKLDSS